MTAAGADAALVTIERVRFRRVSPTLAFADVRLREVNLCNLRIEKGHDGCLIIKAPEHKDKLGRCWPAYALQPECRASIEAEIAILWARS